MDNQAPILSYHKGRVAKPPPPAWLLWSIWSIGVVLSVFVIWFYTHFNAENEHFSNFFPRIPQGSGAYSYMPLKHDLVTDKLSGMMWDYEMYRRQQLTRLSPPLEERIKLRIGDNPRWNRFVDFVATFEWIQTCAIAALGILSAWLLWKLDWRKQRARAIIAGLFVLVFLVATNQFFDCGYLGAWRTFKGLLD